MSSVENKLKICTGHEWREIRQSYVDFKLRNNKTRPQMCVFTPDDITKQRARLFIPEEAHSHELHRPELFVQKYLSGVKTSLPAIKVDLNTIPGMTILLRLLTPDGYQLISLILTLDGDLVLKNTKSSNPITVSSNTFKSYAVNAQITINEVIAKLSGEYDFEKNKFVLSAATVGEFVSDNVSVTPDTFSASMTPKPIRTRYKSWIIEGQLGYEVNGVIHKDKNKPPPQSSLNLDESVLSPDESSRLGATAGGLGMIGLLFAFVSL